MSESKHTISDLYQMQSLPLDAKIRMTEYRIMQWVDEYGEDGVYISFSGGKDSTVLVDLIDKAIPNHQIPLVFVDTGLEYPEIRDFVKKYGERVTWLRPKMNFKQVVDTYGYPFISKEVCSAIEETRTWLLNHTETEKKADEIIDKIKDGKINIDDVPVRLCQLLGILGENKKRSLDLDKKSLFNKDKYKVLLNAPNNIRFSSRCCDVMKKEPVHRYSKDTGRKPITGQQASESRLRTLQWLKNGCNAFNLKSPISNPLSFWTEQDILLYIKQNNIEICSIYGEIVNENFKNIQSINGQTNICDLGIFDIERPLLKTTGLSRTGCMYCAYGCNREKEGEGRFERMRLTHPKQYDYLMRKPHDEKIFDPNTNEYKTVHIDGLNYKEIIDWLNENGKLNIKY